MSFIKFLFATFLALNTGSHSAHQLPATTVAGLNNCESHWIEYASHEKPLSGTSFPDDSLFLAVRSGDAGLLQRLIGKGAEINCRDERGWTPLDYAKKNNRKEIRDLLLASGAVTYPKPAATMKDGPHVRLIDSFSAEVYFMVHDTITGLSEIHRDTILFSDMPVMINGVSISPADIGPKAVNVEPVSSFKTKAKIFVVGDMHGEFTRTAAMLENNGIIDANGNWQWGGGHLVFMGDIFDRGSEVTEALWMIYRLEKQAAKSGGMVHMVLGNHEPMIFIDDLRYITSDYYSLCDNLGLGYSDIFDRNSLLGLWLRQKPAAVKINRYVFAHGGFSPELIRREAGLDSINSIVWRYLNGRENPSDIQMRQLILGGSGVMWYRGMVNEVPDREVIDMESLADGLGFYDCDAFIVGHTEVDSISYFFDGRVIDVNIPKRKLTIPEQGLLINGRRFEVLHQDRSARKLIRLKRFRQ